MFEKRGVVGAGAKWIQPHIGSVAVVRPLFGDSRIIDIGALARFQTEIFVSGSSTVAGDAIDELLPTCASPPSARTPRPLPSVLM